MKFIVDNQLPPALANWLIEKGHEAEHVFPMGMSEASDSSIWVVALERLAIVVTKDSDFAERRMSQTDGPTVLWLRCGNVATSVLLAQLEIVWDTLEAELVAGQTVVEFR